MRKTRPVLSALALAVLLPLATPSSVAGSSPRFDADVASPGAAAEKTR